MKLTNYSIMPLDTLHLDELCEDIRSQYNEGISDCALFMMALVPEGDPPADKVGILCEKYRLFQDRLRKMGLPSGVLVQASIGHGWVLSRMFPYQSYVGIGNGNEMRVVCPYDEGFRHYIRNAFSVIAAQHPDMIMLDDDFRLMSARMQGCGCPLHVKRFNELWGSQFTRPQIWDMLHEDGKIGDRANEIFTFTQREALIDCARLMREGINSVDPSIPASFCCVGTNVECASEIAGILTGTGKPRIVRINNGHYTTPANHHFTDSFWRAAQSVAKLKADVDIILAETDTCPQNRYSTSAASLHAHFAGTILEGARGAKHWITRLHAYEPESGVAYRRILQKHKGYYEALAEIVPGLRHRGCCIPVTDRPAFDLRKENQGSAGWSSCVLERLGLPFFFSSEPSGIVCLEGCGDAIFDDAQMKKLLSGSVMMASDTARRLIDRGFGEELGVDVREWSGDQPSYEILPYRNNECAVQVGFRELVPLSPTVLEHSTVYHSVDRVHAQRLFPGATIYKNKRGGIIFVFCGTPNVPYGLTTAFSFLNQSRKQQLIDMMRMAGELPIWYAGDEEVYFRTAYMPDGTLFCALFNLGMDAIGEIVLGCDRPIRRMEMLTDDGNRREISFLQNRQTNEITAYVSAHTLMPVILFIT